MKIHTKSHPQAGQTVRIKSTATHPQLETFGGSDFRLEDWWDIMANKSWMHCDRNPWCLIYAIRSASNNLPTDDEVVYGKIGSFGHLVHVSELE